MSHRRIGVMAAAFLALLLVIGLISSRSGLANTAAEAPPVEIYDSTYIYKQIMNHQVPVQHDGTLTVFAWGRHYIGPNGWEIRLNREGTRKVAKIVIFADSTLIAAAVAGGASAVLLSDVILASISSTTLRNVAFAATGATNIILDDTLYDTVLREYCLGLLSLAKVLPQR